MQGFLYSHILRRLSLPLVSPLRLTTRSRYPSLQSCLGLSGVSDPAGRALVGAAACSTEVSSSLEEIWAVERLGKGKWFSSHDRSEGRIPGYIFGKDDSVEEHVLIVVDKYQIRSLWLKLGEVKFLRTVFSLEVYDGFGSKKILYKEPVLPNRLNFDKEGEFSNIGFVRAPPGVKLRLDAPIHFCGEQMCLGLGKGGYLRRYFTHLSFWCLPNELPPYVEVRIDNLDLGDKVLVKDIHTEVPLHPNFSPSTPICEIVKTVGKGH